YSTLLYDTYRNCYYRVVVHPQRFNNSDGSVNFSDNRPWSLQLFDSNLKLIGEQRLSDNQCYYNDIVITKEGLLISNNNEQNPKYRESAISFTLYKLNND